MIYKQNQILISSKTLIFFIAIVLLISLYVPTTTNAQKTIVEKKNTSNVHIYNYSVIHGQDKNVLIVGSVAKSGDLPPYPIEVSLGLNVYNNYSKKYETLIEQPFEKVIYDISHPIPFKFIIDSSKYRLDSTSKPYIKSIKKADIQPTKINTFSLKYNEAMLGPNKELYGIVKNTGPSTIKNLTLYAVVHAKNGTQIDSVKTIVPIIKSNETANFSFIPNKAIKDLVFTYSCVGGELQDINTYHKIKLNLQKTLGYKFSGFMEINSINYNNKTNLLKLEVNNLYPLPAALSLKLIPTQTTPLNIFIDNHVLNLQTMNDKEKTMLDIFIPQGKHAVILKGING